MYQSSQTSHTKFPLNWRDMPKTRQERETGDTSTRTGSDRHSNWQGGNMQIDELAAAALKSYSDACASRHLCPTADNTHPSNNQAKLSVCCISTQVTGVFLDIFQVSRMYKLSKKLSLP
ncbi:hypothetical protein FCULG_00011620 [Fusarium culmorum]|uniref:Uncharacterized protein n=1 Tax=Fusarium culmorum TaxID=5516 RepID=A0A2T4H5S3_FUSCU|nr:hypothetical protein FCULG_00011620 [Fusarium culmorum]